MAMTSSMKENAMNREHQSDDIVELGTVSSDTRGSFVRREDQEGGKQPSAGLSDD